MPTAAKKAVAKKAAAPKDAGRDAKLRESYTTAMTRLREAHPAEFNQLRQAAAKELGIEWTPRPTDEEKAREQMQALLAKYPGLASEYGGTGAEQDVDEKSEPIA